MHTTELSEGLVDTTVHGRYVTRPAAASPAPLLVGFHGYGENAEIHMGHLRTIPGVASWSLVAVQALHAFYRSRTGDVVGSWMTTLNRVHAIADNIAYVDRTLDVLETAGGRHTHLVYAGFSQGVAMAYRAAARGHRAADAILALAGDIPPELKDDAATRLPPILIGCGRQDTWYTPERLEEDVAFLRQREIPHEVCVFDGGHEWTDRFLEQAGGFLGRIASR